MEMTDLIVSTAILDGCESLGKTEVVNRLLLRLVADGYLNLASVPSDLEAVMRRESLGSTGIGAGIAIPHTKTQSIDRLLGIVGLCRPQVEFESIDREPTDTVLLFLSPPDPPGYRGRQIFPGIELLFRKLRDAAFLERLRASTSEQEIRDVLTAVESNDFW